MNEKREFWLDLAIYKGKEFQYTSYGNGKVELFSKEDMTRENILYTVTVSDLDDRYTRIIYAVMEGVSYVVYEIADGIVTLKRFINDEKYIRKSLKDFELVYEQKNHRKNDEKYIEKEILYIDEKQMEKEAVNKKFWPEEMSSGDIMLSVSEDILSIDDLEKVLNTLYGARIDEKGGFPEALLLDQYIAWLNIDNIKFNITLDWGIVTISPKDSRGNKYIREIVDYLNRNS